MLLERTHRCVEMLTGLLEKFPNFSETENTIEDEHTIHKALENAAISLTKILSQVGVKGNIRVWSPCNDPANNKPVEGLATHQGRTF